MTSLRVTVVIPVRDEEALIAGCLEAVAAQDLPPSCVEVLVVDGGSADATVDVAGRVLSGEGWGRCEVLHSSVGDRSSNLNCGLERASAPVVVRVDARSRIPAHYLSRCVELLETRPDVAVVGGRQRAVAAGERAIDAGVARALNNRWGMGLARYRRSGPSGAADTVYLGAYRTADLRREGGWRTGFAVNEDFDLNRRLARLGTVWFDADLTVAYLPRSSMRALIRQYWAFGVGKALYWRLSGDRPRPRQVLLLVAPLVGIASLAAALALSGPAGLGWLVLTGTVVAVGVEAAGADGPQGGPKAHLAALLALGSVGGAWLGGIAVGSLRRSRPPVVIARPAGTHGALNCRGR